MNETGRVPSCAHVLLSGEACDVCGEVVASGRVADAPSAPGSGRSPSPHQYQWLGNTWRCLTCGVQIRNQDCSHNLALAEQARVWTPVDAPARTSS